MKNTKIIFLNNNFGDMTTTTDIREDKMRTFYITGHDKEYKSKCFSVQLEISIILDFIMF